MKSLDEYFNTPGAIAGAIVWFALVFTISGKMGCIASRSCDGGDFILSSIIAMGYLAPSILVAMTVSSFFDTNRKE